MKKPSFADRSRTLSVLCSLILASQLAACGGGGGNGVASTPTPSGNNNNNNNPPPPPDPPPPAPTVSLTLRGKVTDAPIANAEVTATVGGQAFTATADANGEYSLPIQVPEADRAEFVTLTARGVGGQSFVEFTSLAGSLQSLASQAGDDGVLSSAENFSTQITNVSTAHAVYLREANGGEAITTDAALQTLVSQVNAQDVLNLAAAIKLAVDDPVNNPLPEGETSILALASDAAARGDFVDQSYARDPQAFAQAQNAIAQDADLTQPMSASVIDTYVANEGFTTALLSNDATFTFNYTGRIAHFNLSAGGVGSESSETYEQSFHWTVEGSSIRVTYDEPLETWSWDSRTCGDTYAQYLGRYVTAGATITFLNARTVAVTSTSNLTYAACPALNNPAYTTTAARTVLTSATEFQKIDVEALAGNAQTIYVWDAAKGAVVADVAEINADGTGRALLTNQTFTWEMNSDGGAEEQGYILQANFADGTEAEYLLLREIDGLASDIFWEIRTSNNGPVLMGAGASIFADPDHAVTEVNASDVVGRFYQFGVGDEVSGDPRLGGFRLRFDADGRGAQEEDVIDNDAVVVLNELNQSDRAFRWTIEEGPVGIEVVVRRTWDLVAHAYNCEYDEANPDCVLFDERRIIPIVTNDAGRYYWVEVRRLAPPGEAVNANTPVTHLTRFYDKAAATAPAAMSKLRRSIDGSKPRELLRGAIRR
jgi:hypothetical protein